MNGLGASLQRFLDRKVRFELPGVRWSMPLGAREQDASAAPTTFLPYQVRMAYLSYDLRNLRLRRTMLKA